MWASVLVLSTGACVYLGASAIAAFGYLKPPRLVGSLPADFREQVWKSEEILNCPTLVFVPETHGEKVGFVLAHGWGGGQATWASLGQRLADRGYAVMIPSFPGHDQNKSDFTTFGTRESQIVTAIASELRKRGCDKVVGVGVSMGAASLWIAAEHRPEALDAIVSEGSFATLDQAIPTWNAGRMPLGEYVLAPAAMLAQRIAGIHASEIRPVDGAAKFAGKPCVILTAEYDRLVPLPNAEQIAAAAKARVDVIKGAKHAEGYASNPDAYERIVLNLVERLR